MEQFIIDTARSLRTELNKLAELSNKETNTKAKLIEFLKRNTSLRLDDYGPFICAVHEEVGVTETIAFRADMDALPSGDGAEHLCGHDGHCAVLAGLGLFLEKKRLDCNIILIFQHAEETGEGGKICSEVLHNYNVDRVYAFHNIPGWEEGSVLLKQDTFACASRGMTVAFKGTPSHAAYPEYGRNSGFAAARFITALPEISNPSRFLGLTMATLIGAEIGTKAFGTAAANAEVRLTLRAWNDEDLNALIASIENVAESEAARDGVEVIFSYCDIFPATINDNDILHQLKKLCSVIGLSCIDIPEPFRWSEDFGYYGTYAKAVMVGIGSGIDWPALHTESFTFNDNILPSALILFSALAQFG